MSKMEVNIKRVVEGDISNRTTQMHALYEAITNAIHANATRIICRFTTDQDVLSTEKGEIAARKVIAIEIEDNGEGFNDPNYESFGEYRSDYNAELGCKGIGRFVFLKLFEKVTYTSWLAEINKKREFKFDYDFNSENMHEEDDDVLENKTVIKLSNVTSQ